MNVFFVSPSGADSNPGTMTAPFRTIACARDTVRATCKVMVENVKVYIHGGNYYLQSPLVFNEQDGGNNGYSVVYQRFEKEKPVIYGGTPVSGWELWKGSIFRTKVPTLLPILNLTENGERATIARFPKTDYLRTDTKVEDAADMQFTFKPGDIPAFSYAGAQAYLWPGDASWNWMSSTNSIKDIDFTNRKVTLNESTSNGIGTSIDRGSRYFLQNSVDFITQPGDFCHNSADGYLYYWPQSSQPIDSLHIVIPTVKNILEIRGQSPDCIVRNLEFKDLEFNLTHADKHISLPQSNGHWIEPDCNRNGIVFAENAENITIRNCRIMNAGLHGIVFNRFAQKNNIAENWIQGSGYNGIYFLGYAPNEGGFMSTEEAYVNKCNCIYNNFIYDCGRAVGHASGIQMFNSGENAIEHNRIQKMTRYAISFKGIEFVRLPKEIYGEAVTEENHQKFNHCCKNQVKYNDMVDVCRDSSDAGAVESNGTGKFNYVYNNCAHDFYDRTNGYAFYAFMTDNDTDYFIYENNLVYGWEGTDAFYRGGSPNAEYKNNYRFDTGYEAKTMASALGIDWDSIGLTKDFPFNIPHMLDLPITIPVKNTPGKDIFLSANRWNSRHGLWTIFNSFFKFISGSAENGFSWACFCNIDLGKGYRTFVACVSQEGDPMGKQMEIRLDNPQNGTLIGVLQPVYTGSWDNYVEVETSLHDAYGIHDVFFVFRQHTVGNFQWFRITNPV